VSAAGATGGPRRGALRWGDVKKHEQTVALTKGMTAARAGIKATRWQLRDALLRSQTSLAKRRHRR